MSSFCESGSAAMCPIINTMQERVHGIAELVQIATGEELSSLLEKRHIFCATLFLLPNCFVPLEPRGVSPLKPGSADGSKTANESAQQAADHTRHDGRIAV